MIFINYFFVILWACVCQISAPSPPIMQDTVDDQANFVDKNIPGESQRLQIYLQIIKNIDIEQSMESVVELMNMLRLMFPIRFANIKRKMMNIYDPITHRSFGTAFHALMNMLRDKSKRDKLHSIFQELMIPHSSAEPESDNANRINFIQHSDVKFDLPLKYKPLIHQDTASSIAKTAEPISGKGIFENPLTTESTPEERFQEPVLGTSSTETGHIKPSETSRQFGTLIPALENESDQPSNNFSPARIQRRMTSGSIVEGQIVEKNPTWPKPQSSIPEEGNPPERVEEPASGVLDQPEVIKLNGSFERPQISNRMKTESEVPDQPSILQTNISPETSADSPVENLEAKRRDTELRLMRMKSFLDKVRNNSAAPATLQAKAAIISRILAREGVATFPESNGKLGIPRTASQRMEME